MLLVAGCAGGPRPATQPLPAADGVRVLFRVESEGPRGRSRFRMAAALRPPAQARLEFLGPVGGPRLVVATDGAQATAILPAERRYDLTPATPDAMHHLLGLPLDGARLIALLSGVPLCTLPAAPGVAAGAWEATCPAGDIRFSGVAEGPGGPLLEAVLFDSRSGAILAKLEYGDRFALPGGRWPRDIRMNLPKENVAISLRALEGPLAASLSDDLFAPSIPESFERRAIFGRPEDPALFGAADFGGP